MTPDEIQQQWCREAVVAMKRHMNGWPVERHINGLPMSLWLMRRSRVALLYGRRVESILDVMKEPCERSSGVRAGKRTRSKVLDGDT